MKFKAYNKLYRRVVFLVFFVFVLLILLFLMLVLLIFRNRIFEAGVISENTSLIVIISVFSLLIISQGVTIFVSRRITRPVQDISQVLNEVAAGNFDVKIDPSEYKAEIRPLAENLSLMISELKSMEVMRSDFVANVSHEFKAPLSTIGGYVTLLSNPLLTEEQRKGYLDLLSESTRQLSGLVDNILKLSRLESQNIVQKAVKFSLDEQIRRAVLMFEKQWSEKELNLELELPECDFYGNEEMTSQIWINLIGNAVKFSEKGGTVGVKIDTERDGNVAVTVYDNGPGMTEEVKKHLFEKFYQGDTSRKSEGNGLGLALVNTIVKMLNYEIIVESTAGVGSSFTVIM